MFQAAKKKKKKEKEKNIRPSPAKADKLQREEGQTPPTSKTTCAIVYLYFKQGMSAQLQATQNSSVKCTNTLGALHR
jgi:hypothetical protein